MINIKSEREIALMREAGKYLCKTLKEVEKHIKAGVTTNELDKIAYESIIALGCSPSCLNYEGYPKTMCVSVNDEVVHGIPGSRKLKNGDIVSCDLVLAYKGYHADATRTYIVGKTSKENENLIKWTKEAFDAGVSVVKEGAHISDISRAIENVAKKHNLGVVHELVGHGIGSSMHEEPEIPNFDDGNMTKLKAGMTIAIEPMLNLGKKDVYLMDDGWTVKTCDGLPSCHYENTVLVTKDGYEILTGVD